MLPQRVLERVFSFVDPEEKLYLRLVSTHWFKTINKDYFKIGCILSNEVNSLASGFSRSLNPIGIRFNKTYKLKAKDYAPLFKLSNLTSLEIYPIDNAKEGVKVSTCASSDLQKLVSRSVDPKVLAKMTNLKYLETGELLPTCFSLPNLESVSCVETGVTDDQPLPEFSGSTTLTRLVLPSHPGIEAVLPRFPNLKELVVTKSDYAKMALHSLPNLVSLEGNFTSGYPPTLTKLHANIEAAEIANELTTLKNLQELTIKMSFWTGQFPFSELVSLKSFCGNGLAPEWALENLLKLSLKSLSIEVQGVDTLSLINQMSTLDALKLVYSHARPCNFALLSSLTHLKVLEITSQYGYDNIEIVNTFTGLESLILKSSNVNYDASPVISGLRNLTQISVHGKVTLDAALMTNLQVLNLTSPASKLAHFTLPQLTYLGAPDDTTSEFWQCVLASGKLREISLQELSNDKNLQHLTALNYLTKLTLRSKKYATVTCLTNLQILDIKPMKGLDKKQLYSLMPYLDKI